MLAASGDLGSTIAVRQLILPPKPFVCDIAHILLFSIAYPRHEVAVEFEVGSALCGKEAPHVLRISIVLIDYCTSFYEIAMPIEVQFHSPC
jgi:hypothetical protein